MIFASSAPIQAYLVDEGVTNVHGNILVIGLSIKVFPQSAGPVMRMFLYFPFLSSRSFWTADANRIGCMPFFLRTWVAYSYHWPLQVRTHDSVAAIFTLSIRGMLFLFTSAAALCNFQADEMFSFIFFGNLVTYSAKSCSPSALRWFAIAYNSFSDRMLCFTMKSQSSNLSSSFFFFYSFSFLTHWTVQLDLLLKRTSSFWCRLECTGWYGCSWSLIQWRVPWAVKYFRVFFVYIAICSKTHTVIFIRLSQVYNNIIVSHNYSYS